MDKPDYSLNPMLDTWVGIGKGTLKTLQGGSSAMQRMGRTLANVISNPFGPNKPVDVSAPTAAERMIPDSILEPQSKAESYGKTAGQMGSAMLATPLPGGTGVLPFVARSAVSTTGMKAYREGQIPSLGEYGGYGLLDAALAGVGYLGSELYKTSFKGTLGEEKNLIKSFNKSVADIAEELGYTGTAGEIKGQAQAAKSIIWNDILDSAAKNEPVTRKQFLDVGNQIASRFDDLPDSAYKTQVKKEIMNVVKRYAPKVSATGDQLVAIITEINKGLYGEGAKTVLTPTMVSSFENQLKSGIKDLLPKEIRPLYEQYAKNGLIESVMQKEIVRKYLARSIIGAGALGGAALASSLSANDGKINTQTIMNTLAGIIAGVAGGNLSSNTYLSTTVGKPLSFLGKPSVQFISKWVADSLLNQEKDQEGKLMDNLPDQGASKEDIELFKNLPNQ